MSRASACVAVQFILHDRSFVGGLSVYRPGLQDFTDFASKAGPFWCADAPPVRSWDDMGARLGSADLIWEPAPQGCLGAGKAGVVKRELFQAGLLNAFK